MISVIPGSGTSSAPQPEPDMRFTVNYISWCSQRLLLGFKEVSEKKLNLDFSTAENPQAELSRYFNQYMTGRMGNNTALNDLVILNADQLEKLCVLYKKQPFDQIAVLNVYRSSLDFDPSNPDHQVAKKMSENPELNLRHPKISHIYDAVKAAYPDSEELKAAEKIYWTINLAKAARLAEQEADLLRNVPDIRQLFTTLKVVAASRIVTTDSSAQEIYNYKE